MMRAGKLALIAVLCFSMAGCNGLATATKAQNVITAVLTVAKAEVALVPPQDQAGYTNFVNLGITLDGQLGNCITNVKGLMGMGTGPKFAACFTTFASGLTTPAELAQLRILSTGTQGRVGLYLTGIVAGVNLIVAFTAPAVAPPPTAQQMHDLGLRAGVSAADLARAGF